MLSILKAVALIGGGYVAMMCGIIEITAALLFFIIFLFTKGEKS